MKPEIVHIPHRFESNPEAKLGSDLDSELANFRTEAAVWRASFVAPKTVFFRLPGSGADSGAFPWDCPALGASARTGLGLLLRRRLRMRRRTDILVERVESTEAEDGRARVAWLEIGWQSVMGISGSAKVPGSSEE